MDKRDKKYCSARIWAISHKRLKIIAALTGKSVVEVIDLLSEQELSRLEKEKQAESASSTSN